MRLKYTKRTLSNKLDNLFLIYCYIRYLLFSYNIFDIYIFDPLDCFFLYARFYFLYSNISA